MPGRHLGPVQWRAPPDAQGAWPMVQPQARSALGWLFSLIGEQSGVRQGFWPVNLPNGESGYLRALAVRGISGQKQGYVEFVLSRPGMRTEEETITTLLEIVMQHGLEIVDFANLIASPNSTASFVYPSSVMLSRYSGAGWPIPDTDPERNTHWVGLMKATSLGTVPPTWAIDWPREGPTNLTPVDPPSVTGGAHIGLHGVGPASLKYLAAQNPGGGYLPTTGAHQFTGLARTYWQACRGAGMDDAAIADRMPANWSLAPGTFGITYDTTTDRYWALNLSPNGCLAHRLVPGDTTQTVVGWLTNNTITAGDTPAATAYVLADLRADSTALTQTLLGADDMSLAYAGQGTDVPDQDYVWSDDAIPAGATAGTYLDSWNWVTSSPAPLSGTKCHRSNIVTGYAEHGFYNASPTLAFGASDVLTQGVWIDPSNPTRSLMLEIRVGTSYYRPYWGENLILTTQTNRVYMGPLPEAGAWATLAVPIPYLWSGTQSVNGIWFALYDGRVAWDRTAKLTPGTGYGEGPAFSLCYDWSFNASGTAASAVMIRDINPNELMAGFESANSTVTFSFSDGNMAASLHVGTWCRGRPWWPYHKLFYGADASALYLLRYGQIWPGNDDCAAVAPVHCWYEQDTLRVLNYYKATFSAASTSDIAGTCACQVPVMPTTYGSGLFHIHGGYGVQAPMPQLMGTGSVTTRTVSLSKQELSWQNWNASINWFEWVVGDQGVAAGKGCGDGGVGGCPVGEHDVSSHQRLDTIGTWDTTTMYDGYTNMAPVQVGVVVSASPDAYWSSLLYSAVGHSRRTTVVRHQQVVEQKARCRYLDLVDGAWVETIGEEIAHGYAYVCWSGLLQNTTQISDTGTVNVPTLWSQNGVLRLLGTDISAGDSGDWDVLDVNGLDAPYSVDVWAMSSAQGAALYVPYPSADMESINVSTIPPILSSGHSWSMQWVGAS